MPMEYDSISLSTMEPDASLYQKGCRLIENVIPRGSGAWRELEAPLLVAQVAVPADSVAAGSFSDPAGLIWYGTSRVAGPSSRLIEYDPASLVFTNRTPGTDYAGAPARWRFTKFGPTVIAAPENNNTGTALQLQSRSTGNFANLVTSADRPAPKFVGVCKSYLIAAHNLAWGGAGVYAAADPYLVAWSSRNNAAIFTPGAGRSGFIILKTALGEITGLACLTDFFLVFQELGVTRYSWIGGDSVWEEQSIEGSAFGILNKPWGDSVIAVGRDVFYRGNRGFSVVRNGETCEELLPGAAEYFLDGTEYPCSPTLPITGLHHPGRNALVWTANRGDSYFQVYTDLGGLRVSILAGQNFPEAQIGLRELETSATISSLVFADVAASTLSAYRLITADPRSRQEGRFKTLRWRPATGMRRKLHAIRPIALYEGAALPITVTIDVINDPRLGVEVSRTVTSASRDGNGWWTDAVFPLEANEFAFTIKLDAGSGDAKLRELPAIELAFSDSGRH